MKQHRRTIWQLGRPSTTLLQREALSNFSMPVGDFLLCIAICCRDMKWMTSSYRWCTMCPPLHLQAWWTPQNSWFSVLSLCRRSIRVQWSSPVSGILLESDLAHYWSRIWHTIGVGSGTLVVFALCSNALFLFLLLIPRLSLTSQVSDLS